MKLPYDMRGVEANILILIVTLVAILIFISVKQDTARSACLALGYPESYSSLGGTYCVRRVNQTDEVILLDKSGGAKWSR